MAEMKINEKRYKFPDISRATVTRKYQIYPPFPSFRSISSTIHCNTHDVN